METIDPPSKHRDQVEDAGPNPTILVPIRYPLTVESTQTLEHARELVEEEDGNLKILHVNLHHLEGTTTPREIRQAIVPILGSHDPEIIVQGGFLVEEMICEEATRSGTDIIVLGTNRRARWRRILSRILWNDPDIAAYLGTNLDATIEIAE